MNRRKASRRHTWRGWLMDLGWRHAIGLLGIAFALFPILFVLQAALNPVGTLGNATAGGSWRALLPLHVSLHNVHALLRNPNYPFVDWVLNSLVICGLSTVLSLFFSVCAAFAFSRLRFKGRRYGLMAIILVQMFPVFIAVTALYLFVVSIGNVLPPLAPGRASLVLVYLGGSLGVGTWLMKGYIDTIPAELDEAATIDGASHTQIFFGIILRLSAPILVVMGIISFIGSLNEFIIASLFLRSGTSQTLIIGLYGLIEGQQNQDYGQFAVGALITALPVLILFLSFQRWLVGGLVRGAVKS